VCQRFRPHLERVAARFNGPPSTPLVRVATIDCVAQAKLCARFKVSGYPTLRFGHPPDFLGAGQGDTVDGAPREAEVLLTWINTRLQQCAPRVFVRPQSRAARPSFRVHVALALTRPARRRSFSPRPGSGRGRRPLRRWRPWRRPRTRRRRLPCPRLRPTLRRP
jgi:hypothetical protein